MTIFLHLKYIIFFWSQKLFPSMLPYCFLFQKWAQQVFLNLPPTQLWPWGKTNDGPHQIGMQPQRGNPIIHFSLKKVNFHPILQVLLDESPFFPGKPSTLSSTFFPFSLSSNSPSLSLPPQEPTIDSSLLLEVCMLFLLQIIQIIIYFSSMKRLTFLHSLGLLLLPLVTFFYFLFSSFQLQFSAILLESCVSWVFYFLNLQELFILLLLFPKFLHTLLEPDCL